MIDAAGVVAKAILSEHLILGELGSNETWICPRGQGIKPVCVSWVCVCVCVRVYMRTCLLGRQGSGGEGWSVVSNEKDTVS